MVFNRISSFRYLKTKEIGVNKFYNINAYSIERIKKEIRKCVPLCRNCHAEYHHLERQKEIITFEQYLKYERK